VESEDAMANEPINYKAVLADLEAKKAQIESAIAAIKMIASQGGTLPPGAGGQHTVGPSEFLKMSIPDATKKLLETTRHKQSTQAVIDALVSGGLPRSKYATVYSILRRREKQLGDLINMQGDWALAEWYPNFRKGKSEANSDETKPARKGKRGRPKGSKNRDKETPAPVAMAASA
jgi:hypothetical protein